MLLNLGEITLAALHSGENSEATDDENTNPDSAQQGGSSNGSHHSCSDHRTESRAQRGSTPHMRGVERVLLIRSHRVCCLGHLPYNSRPCWGAFRRSGWQFHAPSMAVGVSALESRSLAAGVSRGVLPRPVGVNFFAPTTVPAVKKMISGKFLSLQRYAEPFTQQRRISPLITESHR